MSEVFTTKEATAYIKLSRQTLLKLTREGKIHGNRAGRQYRFLKSELDNFLRGETEEQKAATR
jgi:excisionase family DNA binding protein